MKIITKYKTTELIKLAHDNNKLIVCFGLEEAQRIHKIAHDLGFNIHLPITYTEFANRHYSRRNVESILLDNAEAFIAHVSMATVEAITITIPEPTKV